jgi:enamine deaminase RidA (YjgF/YER057c/UK114 family)
MDTEKRLKELNIHVPESVMPLGVYLPCTRTGSLLFLSGILPLREGKLTRKGRVGESVSIEEAQDDAKQCVINALSVIKAYLGDLNRIRRCIKLNGFVSSAPDFFEQPKVLNAASEFLFDIFGESGRHSRSAIGVFVLPLNSPIEIDFIFEID